MYPFPIMRIYKIEVTQFPLTDAGAGWDLTSGPDIFPNLYLGKTAVWSSTNFFQNASLGTVYSFIPSPALYLNNPFQLIQHELVRLYG